jgi:hypothetical protein
MCPVFCADIGITLALGILYHRPPFCDSHSQNLKKSSRCSNKPTVSRETLAAFPRHSLYPKKNRRRGAGFLFHVKQLAVSK